MRPHLVVVAVLAAGCQQTGTRDGAVPPPRTSATTATTVTPGAPSAPSAPVPPPPDAPAQSGPAISLPAPAPVDVPADLAAAPAWVARRLTTGQIRSRARFETMTLQRLGTRALLSIVEQTADTSLRDPSYLGPWSPPTTEHVLGSIDAAGTQLTWTGRHAWTWVCSSAKVAAARATAVRTRSNGHRECGDKGRWVPPATRGVAVLSCAFAEADDPGDAEGEAHDRVVFAPAPGVEYVWVNDDCVVQGGGYRSIAKDSALARAR